MDLGRANHSSAISLDPDGVRAGRDWVRRASRDIWCLTPTFAPRGADVTWPIYDPPRHIGYICVGDAAAVLDPASSHGVLKALMSGMMAAHVIAGSMQDRASMGAAIPWYTGWLRERFTADVKALTAMYRALPNPPACVREG